MCCLVLFPRSVFPGVSHVPVIWSYLANANGRPWTRRESGLPMTSEDTGLGSLTPTLAGYLGKVS